MARHSNPNAVEGQSCRRGDILIRTARQLDRLTRPGFLAVTSPVFINGSKVFALDIIPVGDTPRDLIQLQRPFDVDYGNVYTRKLTNGTWSAWSSQSDYINALAAVVAEGLIESHLEEEMVLRNITTKTITGTDPASVIPASILGSNVIPAGGWSVPGSGIRIEMTGRITTGVATTGKLDIVLGETTLAGTALTFPNNLTAMFVKVVIDLTLVTTTTVRLTGNTLVQTAIGSTTPFMRGVYSDTDVTIDSEEDLTIDALYTFAGGEGGSLEVRELHIFRQ